MAGVGAPQPEDQAGQAAAGPVPASDQANRHTTVVERTESGDQAEKVNVTRGRPPRGSAARVVAAHVINRRDAGAALYALEVATMDGETWKWRATDLATGLVLEGVTAADSRIRRGLAAIAEQLRRAGA